jgi:hypothetical protein
MLLSVCGVNVLEHLPSAYVEKFNQQLKIWSKADLVLFLRLLLRAQKEMGVSGREELPLFLACVEMMAKFESKSANLIDKSRTISNNSAPINTHQTPSSSDQKSNSANKLIARAVEAAQNSANNTQQSESEQEETITYPKFNASLEETLSKYDQIIAKVMQFNVSIGNVLKNSSIVSVEPGSVGVSVKHFFHKEQLESLKNQAMFEKVFVDIFGASARVYGVIQKTEEVQETGSIDDVLKVFGGTVIS